MVTVLKVEDRIEMGIIVSLKTKAKVQLQLEPESGYSVCVFSVVTLSVVVYLGSGMVRFGTVAKKRNAGG